MRHTLDADKAGSGESLELEALIDALVAYHRGAASHAADAQAAGRPLTLAMAAELTAIREALLDEEERERLDQLGDWLEQDLIRLTPILEARAARRVPSWALRHPTSRLCHAGRPLLVNAIGRDLEVPGAELADDPASDLAALLVGLEGRETPELTRLALDRYLRHSGDYELSRLLSLFGTGHALTAARRALRRRPARGLDPEHPALQAESMAECRRYLALAERIAEFRFRRWSSPWASRAAARVALPVGWSPGWGRSGSAPRRNASVSPRPMTTRSIHRVMAVQRLWISSARRPRRRPIGASPPVPAICWMPASPPAWMPPA